MNFLTNKMRTYLGNNFVGGQPVEELLLVVRSVAQVGGGSHGKLKGKTKTLISLEKWSGKNREKELKQKLTMDARTVRRMNILIE
jgi:hypothetical protein